ncbi:MAG: hypothetical protein D3910_06440, partial [Candidatus Electrothrix sp. ATG2]|nr:hypothetical protein [Candidatus Electrothrix sp. ATG2]
MSEYRIRDGSSQQMRLKAALQPDYVSLDERSLRDSLRFLYEYSAELRYFDENNEADGTWQKFFPRSQKINSDVVPQDLLNEITEKLSDQILNKRLDEIPYDILKEVPKKIRDKVWDKPVKETLAFLKAPDSLPEDKARQYQQPHFALILTFLKLLERTKQHLNGFTKRHLDFYFQDILRMQKKKAVPDHVNVLIDLARQRESFLLPAGTLLHAGKDSAGKLLTYKTDEDTQLNYARIAELRAVYVDKKVTGIRESREIYIKQHGETEETRKGALLEMLKIALGHPDPGDDLLKYPDPENTESQEVNNELLDELYKKLIFVRTKLKMSFFRFSELIKFKNRREGENLVEDDAKKKFENDWGLINRVLERAGKKPEEGIRPDNFHKNFESALGIDPYNENTFAGLPDTSTVNELYELYKKIGKDQIENLINSNIEDVKRRESLISLVSINGEENFESMMRIKIRIDGEWKYIDNILARASGKKIEFSSLPLFKDKLHKTFGFDAGELPGD